MRKAGLFLGFMCLASMATAQQAANYERRPMLEEGKTWVYDYHHFEDRETPGPDGDDYYHTVWSSYYQLKGDTVIDGRQYKKMYRWDDKNDHEKFYAAFREDEEGKVYQYEYFKDSKQDFLILDFSLRYGEEGFENATPIVDYINKRDLYRRYHYKEVEPNGSTYDLGYIAVEGVGFQHQGLVNYLFAPEVDCICDYEELNHVYSDNMSFYASMFEAPTVIQFTQEEQQMVEQNNNFAFQLFRKARSGKSTVLSPLSITYALGMLNNGAAGQTQQEINQVLGFSDVDKQNAFCLKLTKELADASWVSPTTKALMANTIFVNEGLGYHLQDGFVQKANDYYGAQPQSRDFADGQTMDVINQWASDHTENMITEVLNEENFNPEAASYLLNAIYFKGLWSSPFDANETKEESFNGGDKVPMMHQENIEAMYAENELYQTVTLPYGNGTYQIQVYLPREGKTLDEVVESLNAQNWQGMSYSCQVDLKLPRFETSTNQNLVKIMKDLGMPKAFTKDAEFPYFCNASTRISNMFQVGKIKLDEAGTEAAAVTVIEMEETSIPEYATFHANRPFLYIISEQSTGVILFMGQYLGNTTTGIDMPIMERTNSDERIYNLAGQRLMSQPDKGIFIKNGKKIVVD